MGIPCLLLGGGVPFISGIAHYGGELLYLQIWHNQSAGSVHIIITEYFITQLPKYDVHDLSSCKKATQNRLAGLATKKSEGTITHFHT